MNVGLRAARESFLFENNSPVNREETNDEPEWTVLVVFQRTHFHSDSKVLLKILLLFVHCLFFLFCMKRGVIVSKAKVSFAH